MFRFLFKNYLIKITELLTGCCIYVPWNVGLLYVESKRNVIMKNNRLLVSLCLPFPNNEYLFFFCDFGFFPFIFALRLTNTLREHIC